MRGRLGWMDGHDSQGTTVEQRLVTVITVPVLGGRSASVITQKRPYKIGSKPAI